MFERCNDLFRILKFILFNPGCTLDEIAAAVGLAQDYTIKIIFSIHDEPMQLFKLQHHFTDCGAEHIDVLTDLNKKQLVSKVKWNLDTQNMDIIPVRILNDMERRLLEALIETSKLPVDVRELAPIIEEIDEKHADTMFLFDMPSNDLEDTEVSKGLKVAIQGRNYVKVFFYGTLHYEYVKPLGFLHNENSGVWSLICQDELQVYKIIDLRRMKSIEIKARTFSKGMPLNAALVKTHLENKDMDVEIIIENQETVLDKLKRQLKENGKFYQNEKGTYCFKGKVQNLNDFKIMIMRLGSSVQVIEPMVLREELIEEARLLLQMHQKEFGREHEYPEYEAEGS